MSRPLHRVGPPRLKGEVHVAATADRLYDDLAMLLLGAASDAVGQRDAFHLALSGGSPGAGGPEPFYMRLVIDPRFRALPWDRTHLWIVDEPRVPENDERSSYRLICESLVDHVPMRRRQKHPIPVMLDDPAAAYEQELREVFRVDQAPPRLDFVLLEMGEDGHTAGLFPHAPAASVTDRWVAVHDAAPLPRVTMTLPLINAARMVAVLAVGGGKMNMLQRLEDQIAQGPDPAALPISGVDPEAHGGGMLLWYLDAEAVGS